MQADNAVREAPELRRSHIIYVIIVHQLLHVMLKRRLNLFTAENNSESVDVLTHSNTGTPGMATCLPVAAVECLKLKR